MYTLSLMLVANVSLSVYFSKHNIKGSDNGHNVSQHVILANMVGQGQVKEAWGLDLASVWSGASVRHQVNSKLSLGCLNSSVGGTSWHSKSLQSRLMLLSVLIGQLLYSDRLRPE